jgi:hypothetical protein
MEQVKEEKASPNTEIPEHQLYNNVGISAYSATDPNGTCDIVLEFEAYAARLYEIRESARIKESESKDQQHRKTRHFNKQYAFLNL